MTERDLFNEPFYLKNNFKLKGQHKYISKGIEAYRDEEIIETQETLGKNKIGKQRKDIILSRL